MTARPAPSAFLEVQGKRWRRFLFPAAAFLIAVFLFFFGLGSYPLMNPDEGRNAQVALEMRDSGAWLVPTLNGHPYLDKPAFYFRAVALSIAAFGRTEAAARLPSALFALCLCILVYFFCRRAYGERLASLAVAVFASTPLVFIFARIVIPDMPLAFFTTASILTAYRAEESGGRTRRLYYLLSAAAAGFGTLVKGPVGFIIPALVIVVFQATQRNGRAMLRLVHPLNVLIFLVVVLPWFIGLSLEQPDFLRYGLVEETFRRYTVSSLGHREPPWYYLPVMATGFLPYTLLLPGAILSAWRSRRTLRRTELFLMIWALVVVVFFSTSRSKLPGYILSAMVPLGILTADLFEHALSNPEGRSGRSVFSAVLALSFVSAALAAFLLYAHFHPKTLEVLFHLRSGRVQSLQRSLSFLAAPVLVVFLLALLAWIVRRVEPALVAFLLFPLAVVAFSSGIVSQYAESRSSRSLSAQLRQVPSDTLIGCIRSFPGGLRFYLDRPLVLISDDGHELTSNYVTYSLGKPEAWPPGFVRMRDFDGWLLTQHRPVLLLASRRGRDTLEGIALRRGVPVSEYAGGWYGAWVDGPGRRTSAEGR